MTSRIEQRRDQLVEICLALPEAEGTSRTGQHMKFIVRGRTFAYYLNDHHGDGIIALCCKAASGGQQVLVDGDPDRFSVPSYLGPKGWVSFRLDSRVIDWGLVRGLIENSYRMAAPKRLAANVSNERSISPKVTRP